MDKRRTKAKRENTTSRIDGQPNDCNQLLEKGKERKGKVR